MSDSAVAATPAAPAPDHPTTTGHTANSVTNGTSNAAAAAAAPSAATAAAASSSTAAPAAAAPAAQPPRYTVPHVPDDADPLDYINYDKLKEDNKSLPTTKEGVEKFLNDMPITAEVMPDRPNMNHEFAGIQSIIDETPLEDRAENFKESGNQAYKLALRMQKDYKELAERREKQQKEMEAAGKWPPTRTSEEEKVEADELDRLKRLKEGAHKRLLDAVEYYTHALLTEADPEATQQGKLKLPKHLKAQLYTNRALVHMQLENYGRVQEDCDAALKLEPRHAKAAYRGAQACLAVHPPKLAKARDYVAQGRVDDAERRKKDWQFRAEQKSFEELQARIDVLQKQRDELDAAKKRKEEAQKLASLAESHSLAQALQSRGLKMGAFAFDFANSAYAAQCSSTGGVPRPTVHPPPPAPYASSTSLRWPLLFLYPEVLQSDFIQECAEDATLAAQLQQMFPPQAEWAPWDDKKKYHLDNLSIWIDTRGPNVPADSTPAQDAAARLLVNPQHSLRSILSNPKLLKKGYVIPGVPTFIVLPKQ